MKNIIDELTESIRRKNNPSCVGLDTDFEYLPSDIASGCTTLAQKCSAILEFNKTIIDNIHEFVPSVKVQIAYYEAMGSMGLDVFASTMQYAKSKGMITIADAKRGDIGATAKMYANAFLSKSSPFECDFLTVNGYLGTDGLVPFVDACKQNNKGLFVLVRTSNPSGVEIQGIQSKDGSYVYQQMANICTRLGHDLVGQSGYSSIGAVLGSQYGNESKQIRKEYSSMFFLVPGYGAQGGKASDAKACMDVHGNGAIINSSRGILCAYRDAKYSNQSYHEAAKNAALAMQKELYI